MKVALIHMRLALKGGLETRLFNYINYFLDKGDEVTVIVSKIDPSIEVPKGVKILKIDLSLVPKPVRMFFFNKRLKSVMEHHHFDYSLSLGRTAHQHAVICPGNHLGYLKAMNISLPNPVDLMNIYLDRKAFQNSKVIFAASEMIKKELVNFYRVDEKKIRVVYPPLDANRFKASLKNAKEKWREKYGLHPQKKSFVINSSSPHIKNFPLAVKVFRQLANEPVELIAAGDCFDDLPENVKSLGFCKDMQELYAAADFTIHPSRYEPFGQVVSESLACGTPVIISHKTAAKELITPKEGMIVDDFKVESWVNAVKKAMSADFEVSPSFVHDHQLTLEEHMDRLLPPL